jgi:hypothetical protein
MTIFYSIRFAKAYKSNSVKIARILGRGGSDTERM